MKGPTPEPKLVGSFKYTDPDDRREYTLEVYESKYVNNLALAVFVQSSEGEAWATLSENHDGFKLEPREFVAQTRNFTKDLQRAVLASGLVEETGKELQAGYLREPIWRLRD